MIIRTGKVLLLELCRWTMTLLLLLLLHRELINKYRYVIRCVVEAYHILNHITTRVVKDYNLYLHFDFYHGYTIY